MSKGRILVVEDETDIANLLQIFFTNRGYDVDVAHNGREAFERTRSGIPDLIVLDIMLPDTDGYEICRKLRTTTRTSHIPIVFLTQRDERSDVIAGLELGADDYVTKPFDMEELGLRVRNAIASHRRMNMTDPRTGLPAARLVEDKLRELIDADGWTYTELTLDHLQPFKDRYGYLAAEEVLRYATLLLNRVMNEYGSVDDFVGQASDRTFVVITYTQNAYRIIRELQRRFADGIGAHYHFRDLDQGGMKRADGSLAPLVQISGALVSSEERQFTDIREITEAAAESRSQRQNSVR